MLVAERNRLDGLRSGSRDASSKSDVECIHFINILWLLAYLLSSSSGVLKKCLTEFFAVLERILLHFGTPSGTPSGIPLSGGSTEGYVVQLSEGRAGASRSAPVELPVLLQSTMGVGS